MAFLLQMIQFSADHLHILQVNFLRRRHRNALPFWYSEVIFMNKVTVEFCVISIIIINGEELTHRHALLKPFDLHFRNMGFPIFRFPGTAIKGHDCRPVFRHITGIQMQMRQIAKHHRLIQPLSVFICKTGQIRSQCQTFQLIRVPEM